MKLSRPKSGHAAIIEAGTPDVFSEQRRFGPAAVNTCAAETRGRLQSWAMTEAGYNTEEEFS